MSATQADGHYHYCKACGVRAQNYSTHKRGQKLLRRYWRCPKCRARWNVLFRVSVEFVEFRQTFSTEMAPKPAL